MMQKNYYEGGGKERSRKWYESLSPEQKARRKETAKLWKARNQIRVMVERIASNAKVRLCKEMEIDQWTLLGCNVVELQAYIEDHFAGPICWANRRAWEIDHIEPIQDCDLKNMKSVLRFGNYTNLQILVRGAHHEKSKRELERKTLEWWHANSNTDWPGFRHAWAAYCDSRYRAKWKQ